jgi:2-polyprenyl-3-methyl-5-hydroxy-6-metoxy-1,4-benzoquinol methylase
LANDDSSAGLKAEEITEVIREIRARVRARHPEGSVAGVALPDLMPVLRARDAAEAKVASIGTVNPRRPGPFNALIQSVKRLVARLLDWHVREQVEFNRSMVSAVDAVLEALDENNRALARLAASDEDLKAALLARLDSTEQRLESALQEARELKDIRSHWAQWRQEWEAKLSVNEVQFLRSVADLQAGFTHRATLMEANFRDLSKSQHKDFTLALERSALDIQERLWADLDKIRLEFERLIHAELRLARQRAALAPPEQAPAAIARVAEPAFDFLWFAERFRGSQEHVRNRQKFYVPFFKECGRVLDLGCGRGEFLELMKEAGIEAGGVDISEECVALCRSKGLRAEKSDLFVYLNGLAGAALDGAFLAQVVEHLPPERIPELIRLASVRLARGGLLAIETPNPECLAVFATHFLLDPSHTRPIPPALLHFYMEEAGFGKIEIHRLSPAVESLPALASLPQDFRDAFFGGLDYAILGRKL